MESLLFSDRGGEGEYLSSNEGSGMEGLGAIVTILRINFIIVL